MKTMKKAMVTVLTALIAAVAPDHVSHIESVAHATADSTQTVLTAEREKILNATPSPALAPADVVQIVVEALGMNDYPHANAGAEVAFRFSSPDNRRTTGPLEKFIELVHNPVYRPVLNHIHARYGKIKISENQATVPVIIVSESAERHGYLFTLKRQVGGEFDRCWMTDSVLPFDVETEEEPSLVMKTSLAM